MAGCPICRDGPRRYTEHRFLVGATFHFGVDDLKTQDRRGATLDTPDVGRWTGSTIRIIV